MREHRDPALATPSARGLDPVAVVRAGHAVAVARSCENLAAMPCRSGARTTRIGEHEGTGRHDSRRHRERLRAVSGERLGSKVDVPPQPAGETFLDFGGALGLIQLGRRRGSTWARRRGGIVIHLAWAGSGSRLDPRRV